MRNLILLFLLIIGFEGIAQTQSMCDDYLETLEGDIIFNEFLTDSVKVAKIFELINEADGSNFDKKDMFLEYARVNLTFTKNINDQALYQFVELTEVCDTTDQTELRIYLGSLLQISSVLRENNAFKLSLQYIEKGISIIERENLKDYPWIQDYYNDAAVDLLSMGDLERSRVELKKANSFKGGEDLLQNAMIEFNLSFLYYELQKIDSAIYHQKNTCAYLEEMDSLSSFPELYGRYGNSLGSLAIFYYSNGDAELAKETALKAKKVYEEIDVYDSGRYPYLHTLINLSIDINDSDETRKLQNEIASVAEKVEAGRFNLYWLLSESYHRIGNVTRENEYLEMAYSRFQQENFSTINKLQQYNSQLQSQILQREKIRFQQEKDALNRKASLITSIISLVFVFFITVLYMLYIRARNKKNLLQKEKEISEIEFEKNEIKSKLTESELNEKRLVTNRLASHIKLKQQTESAFLQKIKDLKRSKPQNIEAEISELHVKMINLINIDQNIEHHVQVDDMNQEFRLKLKQNHPELNEKELQFCSYLLLELTAKEIGSVTNKSDGAVRVYKNRLKNKLVGDQEIDLVDYLQNL